MSLPKTEGEGSIEEIKEAMVQKHIPFIERAGKQGVQILCLQEIFNTPYFCPGQDRAWYESAERGHPRKHKSSLQVAAPATVRHGDGRVIPILAVGEEIEAKDDGYART